MPGLCLCGDVYRAQLLQQSRRAAGADAEEEAERQQREQVAREREKDIERAVRLEVQAWIDSLLFLFFSPSGLFFYSYGDEPFLAFLCP